MGRCLVYTLGCKCYFRPPAIMGFSASTLLLLLFYFWQRDSGGTPLPAQSGPPGSPLQPSGWRPGRSGGPTPPLSLGLTHGLVNGRTEAASSGEGVCPPSWRPSAAPPGSCRGSNCISQGPSAFPWCAFVLVLSGLEDFREDQVLKAEPVSQKLNHQSLSPVEVMFSRGTHTSQMVCL